MKVSSATTVQSPRVSTVSRIERALRNDIAAGVVGPGARLDEVALTERFGVSRTPIREALGRMMGQGILVPGEKRGVRVAEYSREQLAQIFEVMNEIEAVCARVAAQRLTFLTRAAIERAQTDCLAAAEAGDRAGYLRANEDFHDAIYAATGNPYLAEMASEFRERTGPFRAKKFATHADLLASAEGHRALMASIFSEDSKAASEGMRAHMTTSFMQALAAN